MADQQIEALGPLTSLASGDEFLVNDVSDTTDDAGGTVKKITSTYVAAGIQSLFGQITSTISPSIVVDYGLHSWEDATTGDFFSIRATVCNNSGNSFWRGRRARGTTASPTAVQSGDYLTAFSGLGYDGNSWVAHSDGAFQFLAAENFTSTSHATYATISLNPSGVTPSSSSKVQCIKFEPTQITLGGSTTACKLIFLEPSGSGTNSTSFIAGAMASDINYTLPTSLPTTNQVLAATGVSGSAVTLGFATLSGTGDVVGPASATDNAICRFDSTTGKLVQNSAVTVADTTGTTVWPTTGQLGVGTGSTTITGKIETLGENASAADNSIVIGGYGSANAAVFFRRARTSFSGATAVQSGDILGAFSAFGYDTQSWSTITGAGAPGAILFYANQTFSSTAHGAYIAIGTCPNDSTTRSERMRFTAAGPVLIGTTTEPSGTATKCLIFGDNAGNPTPGTNTASIFAKDVAGTVEMFAGDEAGNVTQISAHANLDDAEAAGIVFEPDDLAPWVQHTKNIFTGVEVWRYTGPSGTTQIKQIKGTPEADWDEIEMERKRKHDDAAGPFIPRAKPRWR